MLASLRLKQLNLVIFPDGHRLTIQYKIVRPGVKMLTHLKSSKLPIVKSSQAIEKTLV